MRYRLQRGRHDASLWVYLRGVEAARPPCTGLGAATPGAAAHYLRDDMAAPARIGLVPGLVGRVQAGGFAEVDAARMPGLYELGLPPAVVAAGADIAFVVLRFPGVRPCGLQIELLGFDPRDGAGLGLAGFTRAVRHDHLTRIFARVMQEPVRALVSRQEPLP